MESLLAHSRPNTPGLDRRATQRDIQFLKRVLVSYPDPSARPTAADRTRRASPAT